MGKVTPRGEIDFSRSGAKPTRTKEPQDLYDRDSVHTLENSHATLEFKSGPAIQLGVGSTFVVHKPESSGAFSSLGRLARGVLYYFSRQQNFEMQIETQHATAAPRGTEFVLQTSDESTLLVMYDGQATLSNALGIVTIGSGGTAVAEKGQAPKALIRTTNVVQWWLHYPGVLDPDDLALAASERAVLEKSIAAYQRGDLRSALLAYPGYPSPADPVGPRLRTYLAALYLGVGEVGKAEALLKAVPATSSPARGLRWMIDAVQKRLESDPTQPESASEALGLSYYLQARQPAKLGLLPALAAATNAVGRAPNFGFARVRLAELEFSFGRVQAASRDLARGLELSPDNPQVHALQGFLFSAQDKGERARQAFDVALHLDSGVEDAWLGRGLSEIHRGNRAAGRDDLKVAVITEANRSLLRSYLGKAFADAGELRAADLELRRARELDPNDPTPWFYSALLDQQANRVNTAIEELEKSEALNNNRALFRSRLLLDQDQAVRNANLAAIYGDAGLEEVSLREATKALANDYGNYSAHLFLANSYDALRDPALVSLRYESVTFSEYLLANLLAPVGGTGLSPTVSQQEYTRLFESNHLGFTSATDYRSDGVISQSAVQYGVIDKSEYAVEGDYRVVPNPGGGPGLEQLAGSIRAKQQLTLDDSVYVEADYDRVRQGDLRQVYDPKELDPSVRVRDTQSPNAFLGYHHQWSPGMHTLLLLGNVNDRLTREHSFADGYVLGSGELFPTGFDLQYRSETTLWDAEVQQIWQTDQHALIGGARFQTAQMDTTSRQFSDSNFPVFGQPGPASDQAGYESQMRRVDLYTYYQQKIGPTLTAIGGVAFQNMQYPADIADAPISKDERHATQVAPKVGLVWSPTASVLGRAAYSRSLGGLSFDTSVRLEPSQLAGFNQAYRSIAPESVVGSLAGAEFDVLDLGMEYQLPTRTYFGWQLENLRSVADEEVGAFEYVQYAPRAFPMQLRQNVDYNEKSLALYVNQLLGANWSIGSRYRLTDSHLHQDFQNVAASSLDEALLHELNAFLLFNHESGFFSRLQGTFIAQDTLHGPSNLRPEGIWQMDLYCGYRFPRRHAEVLIGVANLTDQNYRLNPVNLYPDLPRDRSLVASLRLNF